ncbi:YdcH family protein [Pseudogemmobacter sonorensis]|uniref:YdcH family protein n=1 Tax=Pseudogemmobacter sonorensis TaxID=2989681 RepID=UPI00369F7126
MSNTPHTLQEEFPGEADAITALKTSNARFAKLLEEYDEVNDKVHRAESRIDAVSNEHEEGLRRQRSRLKDQIWSMIKVG